VVNGEKIYIFSAACLFVIFAYIFAVGQVLVVVVAVIIVVHDAAGDSYQ